MHFVHTSESKIANKLATIPNKMLIETTSNLTWWHVAGGVGYNVHGENFNLSEHSKIYLRLPSTSE